MRPKHTLHGAFVLLPASDGLVDNSPRCTARWFVGLLTGLLARLQPWVFGPLVDWWTIRTRRAFGPWRATLQALARRWVASQTGLLLQELTR